MDIAQRLVARLLIFSLVATSPGPAAWAAAGRRGPVPGAPLPGVPAVSSLPALPAGAPTLPAADAVPGGPAVPGIGTTPVGHVPTLWREPQVLVPEALRAIARPDLAAPAAPLAGDALRAMSSKDPSEPGPGEPSRAPMEEDHRGASLGFDAPRLPQPGDEGEVPAPAEPSAAAPFVPVTVKIAALEAVAKADPEKGLAAALAAFRDDGDRRPELKIAALRVLEGLDPAMTRAPLGELLAELNAAKPGRLAATGRDELFYFQREVIKLLGQRASPGPEATVAELRKARADINASVRLMAGWTLQRWGQDPGQEAEPGKRVVAIKLTPELAQKWGLAPKPSGQPSAARKLMKLMFWLAAALLAINLLSGPREAPPAPQPAPSAQVEAKPADPAAKAPTVEESLERIAKETKRAAEASERSAKAVEEAQKPKPTNPVTAVLGLLFQLFLFIGIPILLLIWFQRRMGAGMTRAKVGGTSKVNEEKPQTRFSDVAGIDESLVEVQEIMDFLRNPQRYRRMGARIPKGVLLEGPPGTGKTLLARAMAGEAGVPFLSISGSDFIELFVGMGAARVRDLFEQAKAKAPAIIFIDELDAVGKARGGPGGLGGGHDEREQTINALLTAMDGFDNSAGIIVMAATNRVDVLDPALVRPGRFDRKIFVSPPQVLGREAILQLHARGSRLAPEADLRYVSRRTAGLSGAYLENVVNEAALSAVRRGADAIGLKDLDEAVDAVTIGKARHLHLAPKVKRRIAFHEAGHALANLFGPNPTPVNKFTIIPHGSKALGFAESGSEDGDKYLYERVELEARIEMLLGGLVAEKLVFGDWSTGPGSDLDVATDLARTMVQRLGMSEKLGLAVTAADPNNPFGASKASPETQRLVDVEVQAILAAALEKVTKRLLDHRAKLEALVAAVLEKETLTRGEIEAILWPDGKTPFGDVAPAGK